MSYQALYRVYRPQNFKTLIGQDAISQTLLNALRTNRIAHAYLFCGPRGTGKTSTSKILAKAVNCLSPVDGEPCNVCANCQAINDEAFLDVVEIDAASNRGIDEIRNLREQVRFAPSVGKRKVYIIDEVHMLTTEAFNALLKTLEEPPEHVLFILATTDPQKVPKTVLSRTQRFDFHRISPALLAKHLRDIVDQEGIDASEEALGLIAKHAQGGMRDAISLLDQAIAFGGDYVDKAAVLSLVGGLEDEAMEKLFDALLLGDTKAIFDLLADLSTQGAEPKALLASIIRQLRDLLLIRAGQAAPEGQWPEYMVAHARQLGFSQLQKLLSQASERERELRIAPDGELVLELSLIDMLLTLHQEEAPAPRARKVVAQAPAAPEPASTAAPQKPAASAPQAPAAMEAPQPSATAPSDAEALATLNQVWPQVVDALKDVSIRIHAFVKPCTLRGVDNGVLTLYFPRAAIFNCKQMKLSDNQKILSDTLAHFYPHPLRFECILEDDDTQEPTIDLVEGVRQVFGDVPIEIIDN